MKRRRTDGIVAGDDGTSMVELSVVMLVAGLMMTVVVTVTMGVMSSVRDLNATLTSAAGARLGVEAMTRTLRAATVPSGEPAALVRATPTALTFYSSLDRRDALVENGVVAPTKVEYFHSGSCLWEAQTPARALAPSSPPGATYAWDVGRTEKCLVRTVVPTSLFGYFTNAADATPLTTPVSGLTASALAGVRSVRLSLDVATPTQARPVPLQSRVTLANLPAGGGS